MILYMSMIVAYMQAVRYSGLDSLSAVGQVLRTLKLDRDAWQHAWETIT